MIIHKKDKKKMAGMVEDILYTAGELMHCVEEMRDEEGFGERYYGDRYGSRYGMRDGGRYGMRGGYGMRDWDDMDEMMERRRRY